jgi:hypothetical protein
MVVGVHCGGRIDGPVPEPEPSPLPQPQPCAGTGTSDAIECVARCGGAVVYGACGVCPTGTQPKVRCAEPPKPPGSEQCPWTGARDGDLCDRSSEGVSCLAAPLACADGTTLQATSCTCYGGRFMCSPEPPDCCPAPYHLRTAKQDDSRCVWSCGKGTQPDFGSLECVCQQGKVEVGTDSSGRRVCQ